MALEHIERRAARIKARREALELTQEQVAERMQDIHAERHPDKPVDKTRGQMVSDWERAVNEPSGPKLELLAAALDWTVADLSADAPTEKQPERSPLDALSKSDLPAEVSAAVDALRTELVATRTQLLARIERAQQETEALLSKQAPPASRKKSTRK